MKTYNLIPLDSQGKGVLPGFPVQAKDPFDALMEAYCCGFLDDFADSTNWVKVKVVCESGLVFILEVEV